MKPLIFPLLWLLSICVSGIFFHRAGYDLGYRAGEKLPIALANKPHACINLHPGAAYITFHDSLHTVPVRLGRGQQIPGYLDSIYAVLHGQDFIIICRVEEGQ